MIEQDFLSNAIILLGLFAGFVATLGIFELVVRGLLRLRGYKIKGDER